MTEVRTFSPWCQMCLDGEDKGRVDAHQLHVLRLRKQRAAYLAQKFPWRWKLADKVNPCPREGGAGEQLLMPKDPDPAQQIHTEPDEAGDDQPMR